MENTRSDVRAEARSMNDRERGYMAADLKAFLDYLIELSREDDVNDREPWNTQSWWPHVSDDFKRGWCKYVE